MYGIESAHPYYPQLEFLVDQAMKAGAKIVECVNGKLETEIKEDNTPVTVVDKTINHDFILAVEQQFPEVGVVGEEESTAEYGMGKRYIIDPVDGTAALLVGLNSAMSSMAYVEDGKTMVAVANEPVSKQLFVAVRGAGSFLNGKALKVSSDSFEDGLIALAPDYIKASAINEPFVQKLLAMNKELQVFPGAVFRSTRIATGQIAGFPHPRVKPYDIAAANLIITEAGGRATDIHGNELDFSTNFRGAVLSNGVTHQALLDLFK